MYLYDKRPLKEIEIEFDHCRRDHSMRSLAAVLRIGKEQFDARNTAKDYAALVLIFAVFTGLLGAYASLDVAKQTSIEFLTALTGTITFILVLYALRSLGDFRQDARERRALKEMVEVALESLLAGRLTKFRPPDKGERRFLRRLRGVRDGSGIAQWINYRNP